MECFPFFPPLPFRKLGSPKTLYIVRFHTWSGPSRYRRASSIKHISSSKPLRRVLFRRPEITLQSLKRNYNLWISLQNVHPILQESLSAFFKNWYTICGLCMLFQTNGTCHYSRKIGLRSSCKSAICLQNTTPPFNVYTIDTLPSLSFILHSWKVNAATSKVDLWMLT